MTELKKLLTVKSITTLLMTVVFAVLLLTGQDIPQEFVLVYNTIIAFYFGTQYEKTNQQKKE